MPAKRKLHVAKPRVAKPRVAKPRTAAAKVKRKPQPTAIDRARSEAMAAIARQRGLGDDANVFLDKAHRLLTRHWAKADWTARDALIKTADWLIRVAAANPAPPARSTARGTKRQRAV